MKKLLSFIGFCVLSLAIIFGFGELVRDKSTTISSMYSEPDNSIDVIVVGSSHVNSAYIPAVLWEENHISRHNVYSWSQPIWISYHYIIETLKTQDLKVVVVDLYGAMYGNSDEQPQETDKVNYLNSFTIDTSLNKWNMIKTVRRCGIDLRDPLDFTSVIKYHTAWKNINFENMLYNPHEDPDFMKSWGIQSTVNSYEEPFPLENPTAREPYERCVEYIDKLKQLSEKEGFELVFVLTPYTYMPQESEIFEWFRQYSEENDIPFLDMCSYNSEYANIDYSTDMMDASHVNYKGALKITRCLGDFLAKNYPYLVDNKAEFAEHESEDAKKTYRVIEVNDTQTADYTKYFEYLKNDENSIVLYSRGDGSLPKSFTDACAELGIKSEEKGVFVRDGSWQALGSSAIMKDVNIDSDIPSILMGGTDYFENNSIAKFATYDKILGRMTLYFWYDADTDSLIFGCFPAKANGQI